MNIQKYQQHVTRTFPDLGSKLLNSIHCVLGIGSELLEEATKAMLSGDKVNLGEELADALWYACNYATIHKIKLPEKIDCLDPKDTTAKEAEVYYQNLNICMGKLMDLDKRELAYGKLLGDESARVKILFDFISAIEYVALENGIRMSEYRDKVIKKLLLRYPVAEGFTVDRAVNRDLKSERTILEGKEAA